MSRSRKRKKSTREDGHKAAAGTPSSAQAEEKGTGTQSKRPLGKRLLFSAITLVAFFGLLEVVLAAFGIRPIVVEKDPYVGFSSSFELFEPVNSGRRMRTARNKLALFNDQSFPARKSRGTRRVFTVGGSVAYGRPFDDRISFSGWLRTYLEAADPARDWEVINAGGISYASYRVATLMEELVEYDPDLFIIYTGHNEFLEKRTYGELIAEPEALTQTKLLLQRSRLWALGRGIASARQKRAEVAYEMHGEVRELLDSSAGLDYYFRDDAFERQVLDHYRFNLQRMIQLARSSGADVILVSLPVNEKDLSPFKSQHRDGLSESQRNRHAELLVDASTALATGDSGRAAALARSAIDLDPLYADGHYVLGRALLLLDQPQEAAAAFAVAIEEDVCPLRALAETNALVVEAAIRDGVRLVDYRRLLKQHMQDLSGHTNLGDELLLDHVHPTVEAHGILARALVEEMADMGLLDLPAGWPADPGEKVTREVLARVDAETQARAYKNLSKVLIWAGKKQDAEKYVRLAAEVIGDDWEVHYNAGSVALEAESYESAIDSLQEAIRLHPDSAMSHDMLAMAYQASGQFDRAVEAGEKAVAIDPKVASHWNNLGTFYDTAGDDDGALRAAREAVRLDPGFAEAHNNLGKIQFDRGRLEDALRSLERAMALRPSYIEAMENRALVLGERGDFEAALEGFTTVVEMEPGLAAARVGRARALLALGDVTAATAELEAALSLDPRDIHAYEMLAMSLAQFSTLDEATALVERGMSVNPESATLRHLYGRFLAQQGRYDLAAASLVAAVGLDPALVSAQIDLGNLWMMTGRHAAAIGVYREVLRDRPDDDRLHHVLATALLISGRVDEAQAELETALEINPENAAAAQDLAQVYERSGDRERALELYRRASRLDPSLTAARESAARLGGGRDGG